MTPDRPVRLFFEHGTLVVTGVPDDDATLAQLLTGDARTGTRRAPAWKYRELVTYLHKQKSQHQDFFYEDEARAFEPLRLSLTEQVHPFPHQEQALDAWVANGKRGTVVLPTGAGKTILAVLAIEKTQRPALVVVPTLSLLHQWRDVLSKYLDVPVGIVGGGDSDRQVVTVTTYDSAAMHVEFNGARFGLIVFDEVHHLPSPTYRFIAEGSIAPFRLGLTATPERTDGGEAIVERLVGPIVHRVEIDALEGDILAPYETHVVEVALSDDERALYDTERTIYRDFLRSAGIAMSAPDGWRRFLMVSQRTPEGRRAFAAYRTQRGIAVRSESKLRALWDLLVRHRKDRCIVFTEDNETVHRLSRRLLAPAITHLTGGAERLRLLKSFANGELPVLLTSKVLNEGVDVPEANVGIVLSGSGSVREHVQRLGRVLRRAEGKRAVLYEIRTGDTAEGHISERRRQHRAYQRAAGVPDQQGTGEADVRGPDGPDAAGAGGDVVRDPGEPA